MSAEAKFPARAFDGVPFDDFYDRALPVVYGYLLRLCGGDRDEAWDLTQDSWMTVVDRLAQGQNDRATIAFLLSVARSHYLDSWRRQRRLQRKLRLVWAGARDTESAELSAGPVLDHLSVCSAEHRVVLMLAYVDDLPIAVDRRSLICARDRCCIGAPERRSRRTPITKAFTTPTNRNGMLALDKPILTGQYALWVSTRAWDCNQASSPCEGRRPEGALRMSVPRCNQPRMIGHPQPDSSSVPQVTSTSVRHLVRHG